MFKVSRNLKLLKQSIGTYSHQNFSGIEKKTAAAHEILLGAQSAMLADPTTDNASFELQALSAWEELSATETAFFYQRSRITWLSLSDGNSRLFHRYAASRQALNHIHYLISDSGKRIESQEGIQQLCVNYFSDLLGSPVSALMFIQSDLGLLFDFKWSSRLRFLKKNSPVRTSGTLSSLCREIKPVALMVTPLNSSQQYGLLLIPELLRQSSNSSALERSSSSGTQPLWFLYRRN